jgi:hypothetical protein
LKTGAIISNCGMYRYLLWRKWSECGPELLYIMLNPSTADEHTDDPTIRRCIRWAVNHGYAGINVCNLFAYRATDPAQLKRVVNPVGPLNNQIIAKAALESTDIICARGGHGQYMNRDQEVCLMLRKLGRDLKAFGLTKSGAPKHPLYLPGNVEAVLYGIAEPRP